jgi:regulator of protease activity HflC (stomatin/prohibitin superfamily)
MAWIGFVIFFTLALGGAIAFARFYDAEPRPTTGEYGNAIAPTDTRPWTRRIRRYSVIAYAVLVALFSFLFSVNVIQAGDVGIVYQFGSIVGQRDAGFQLTFPWQSITTQSVQVQRFSNNGEKDQPYVGFSKETQDVFIRATVNYSVSPDAVQNLYRTVGSDWFNKLVAPRVQNFLKEETVKYSVTDIAPQREQIRLAVKQRLINELKPYSITVQDFLLDNVDFDQSFKDSILAKQRAVQDAEAAKNKVEQTKAEAQQAVEQATGQANAAVALATGQAKANDLLNASLTQNVLEYAAINKFSPNVQIALIPSGQGLILDPSTFLKPVTAGK